MGHDWFSEFFALMISAAHLGARTLHVLCDCDFAQEIRMKQSFNYMNMLD